MKTVKLSKETIDSIIENNSDGVAIMVALYKHVLPEWDFIMAVHGYPVLHRKTVEYILTAVRASRKEGNFDLMWMDKGFASMEDEFSILEEWEVYMENCTFTLYPKS